MRWIVKTLALAVVLAAAPFARADWQELKQAGRLRVLAVMVADEPEFFSVDKNRPPGFDQELLQGFAERNDLKLEVVTVGGWDQLIPALEAGKGDLIAGRFTETEARRQKIAFSVPVFPTRAVVLTRKPTPLVANLAQLRAQKVGLVKGTSRIEALAEAGLPAASVDASSPSGGSPEALRSGRITATVDEVAGAILAQRKDPALQLGMFLGPAGNYAYGLRKSDSELLSRLNAHIDLVRQSASWSRLVVKYFGNQALEILKKARTE